MAKIVLKDYVTGHLLYNYLRPDYNPEKHGIMYNYEIFNDTEVNNVMLITLLITRRNTGKILMF